MSKMLSASKLPGSLGFPFIGEAIEVFSTRQEYYLDRFSRYGPAFKTNIMGRNFVVLVGPEANQAILKDQGHKVSSRLGWSILEPLLGDGILLQDGAKHQTTRRLLYSALHGTALFSYFQVISDQLSLALADWELRSPLSLYRELKTLTLAISCQLFLGTNEANQLRQLSQWFLELVAGMRAVVRLDLPGTKFGRACQSRKNLIEHIKRTIYAQSENCSSNVLSQLLHQTEFGEELILTQTLQLLFGGHETTARLLCWAIYELSRHPDWVERLRTEYQEVVGSAALIPLHLKQLTQMGWVLKEVERLYPPVYFIPRAVVEDLEVSDLYVPKGWYIMLSPLLTHRLPNIYPEPESFMPQRFICEEPPFGLIGFGGGVHHCLGNELAQMEMKLFLCLLLRYQWTLNPLQKLPVLQPSRIDKKLKLSLHKQIY